MAFRSVWLISKSSLIANVRNIARFAGKKIIAVVKANAYGHGATDVAKLLEPLEEVVFFAVASPEEGVNLRKVGIKKPILVLFGFFPWEVPLIKNYRLTPVVGNFEELKAVLNLKIPYHLNIDTGMGRCGFLLPPYGLLKRFPPEGIMSHFPSADLDKAYTENQIRSFYKLVASVKGVKYLHLQNSAGLVYKVPYTNLVRVGLTIYGEYSSDLLRERGLKLSFPSEISSPILTVRRLPKGSCISYGCRYRLKKDSWIGIIPFGYADGLNRKLSNHLKVFYKGKAYPIVGNITMDLSAVNFGDRKPSVGERVVLVNKRQKFTDLASLLGTIPYEVMTSIGKRVKRIFR